MILIMLRSVLDGIFETSVRSKFKNQISCRTDNFFVGINFFLGKTKIVRPKKLWQIARNMVKAILGIGLFYIDLNVAVGIHIRMNDFRSIV